ncbi:hypothetical protein [Suttonella indologenes]|uniref:Uncharacterized protein n=1 Tax=Suttonella indologenes TaxID=13276 RepID=A0A380N0F9_9GAMM|nr:hypothetical protein [Suttonella indologenes]SUO98052.1 Uncharacterised protein [Suttonella indologenes]
MFFLTLFILIFICGWLISAWHCRHQRQELLRHFILPTYAFIAARENGLWHAVLLQIIGGIGLAITLIIQQ